MKKLGPAHLAVSCFDGPQLSFFSIFVLLPSGRVLLFSPSLTGRAGVSLLLLPTGRLGGGFLNFSFSHFLIFN